MNFGTRQILLIVGTFLALFYPISGACLGNHCASGPFISGNGNGVSDPPPVVYDSLLRQRDQLFPNLISLPQIFDSRMEAQIYIKSSYLNTAFGNA